MSGLAARLQALARRAGRAEEAVLGALLAAMVILAALQIVLRNGFGTGIRWADPFLGSAMLWLTMLGALAATGRRKHIAIDLVSHLLPAPARRWTAALTGAFSAAVCAGLCAASIRFVKLQAEMGGEALPGVPEWAVHLILPAGFALMALRFAAGVVADARRGRREPDRPEGGAP